MKFVNGLIALIKQPVKLAINWDMSLEQIINKAEQVQATMKQTHKPPQIKNQNRKPNREWSAGKPIDFVKSNYKFSAEKKKIAAPAAKAKGGLGGLYGNSLVLEKGKMTWQMSYPLKKWKNLNRKVNAITASKLAIWHHSAHKRNL